MTLFTESQVRTFAQESLSKSVYTLAKSLLTEDRNISGTESFDVFLSHSIKDADVILGIKTLLERKGLSVYVDWIADSFLDRTKVSTETADRLRKRMKQSKSMIYVHSESSPDSKWMPWELGFFDGYKGVIAILPIVKTSKSDFVGQEFLGLYPYLDIEGGSIFVNAGSAPLSLLGKPQAGHRHVVLREWMKERANINGVT